MLKLGIFWKGVAQRRGLAPNTHQVKIEPLLTTNTINVQWDIMQIIYFCEKWYEKVFYDKTSILHVSTSFKSYVAKAISSVKLGA